MTQYVYVWWREQNGNANINDYISMDSSSTQLCMV